MTIQERTKDLIIQLKKVREREGLSIAQIVQKVEDNGDFVSATSVTRVFASGSEDQNFRYHDTIKPIAKALLGLDRNQLEGLSDEERAAKDIILLKEMEIKERDIQIKHLSEKLEELEKDSRRRIDYLKEQIAIKDAQIAEKDASIKKRDDMLQSLSNGLIEMMNQNKKDEK